MTVGVIGDPLSKDDPALGQFLSSDTLVPDAGLVLDGGRYMYVHGNPLKYTDPTGHFSVEQLNLMGLYESDISAEIWKLLLFLEPNDQIGGPNGSGVLQLLFDQSPGEDARLGLYVSSNGQTSSALEWLTNTGVQSLTVERFFANTPGLQVVWSQGQPSSFWRANVLGVKGSVRDYTNTAGRNRYFDGLRDNFIFSFFKEAGVEMGARNSMQNPAPGRDPRDVTFVFEYDLAVDAANFPFHLVRDYHYRPGQSDSLIGFESYSPMAPLGPMSKYPAPGLR